MRLLGAALAAWAIFVTTSLGVASATGGVRGDVDGDDAIDSIDALLILQSDAGIIWPDPNADQYKIADVNQDGLINSIDATLILQFHAGLDAVL